MMKKVLEEEREQKKKKKKKNKGQKEKMQERESKRRREKVRRQSPVKENGLVVSAELLSYRFSIIMDKDVTSRHRRSARNKDVDSNSKTKLASYPRPTGRRRGTTAAFERKTIDQLNPGLPKPVLQVCVIESN